MRKLNFGALVFVLVSLNAGADDKAVPGGLDKSAIDEGVKKKIVDIRECYEVELKKSKETFGGRLGVKFVIGGDGKVTSATAEDSTLGNAAAEGCILGIVKALEFPAVPGGGVVEVSYPFAFNAEKATPGADTPKKAAKKRK